MKPFSYYSTNPAPYPRYKTNTPEGKEECAKARDAYRKEDARLKDEFFNDAREDLGYGSLYSENQCLLLESHAWDAGHAEGFQNVFWHLEDLDCFLDGFIKAGK